MSVRERNIKLLLESVTYMATIAFYESNNITTRLNLKVKSYFQS